MYLFIMIINTITDFRILTMPNKTYCKYLVQIRYMSLNSN